VPRHLFVTKALEMKAYEDHPLDIGHGQTISQPFIVAAMTELLDPRPDQKILEIGTGSGYQAAVLSLLAREVYTIEIVAPLADRAKLLLRDLGYKNVHVLAGDGYRGWPSEALFDGIIVTAAPQRIPKPLIEQLKVGGRMVIPVGDKEQMLELLEKTESGVVTKKVFEVKFVPMTGEVRKTSGGVQP
jgi:protein-L-isoaspartate(D-aspartate) O-methyltransferase